MEKEERCREVRKGERMKKGNVKVRRLCASMLLSPVLLALLRFESIGRMGLGR